MSIRYGIHSVHACYIISLMGIRHARKIPRPTAPARRRVFWSSCQEYTYEAWLQERKEAIARRPHYPVGKRKSITVSLYALRPGDHFRFIDGHGKATGRRYCETEVPAMIDAGMRDSTRVRLVQRQEEDLLSELTRMRNRAHRAAVKG